MLMMCVTPHFFRSSMLFREFQIPPPTAIRSVRGSLGSVNQVISIPIPYRVLRGAVKRTGLVRCPGVPLLAYLGRSGTDRNLSVPRLRFHPKRHRPILVAQLCPILRYDPSANSCGEELSRAGRFVIRSGSRQIRVDLEISGALRLPIPPGTYAALSSYSS